MKKVAQIFIVIELVCLLGLFLYTQKEEKPEVAISEGAKIEEQLLVANEDTEQEEPMEESTTVATEEVELEIDVETENCYARVTQKSQVEVEEYARQVKELFLNHKWDKIAERISYPIEINGIVYTTPFEIEHMQLEQNYSEMFMSALGQESCQMMYCDSEGICLGSGEVWIAEVEQNGSKELKIVSINRLIKREDESNLLVRGKYQEADWTVARETKYIYDNKEQLWKTVRYDSEGKVQEVCENFYDLDGNVVKWISYGEEGNKTAVRENNYTDKGKIDKGVLYDGEGKVREIYECNYDEAGNLLMKATYDSGGKITQSHECSYDKNGNMIEEISYNSEGTVTKTYDSKGRLLKSVTLDSAGNSVTMVENSYNKAGELIKSHYESQTITETWEYSYSYDEAGNLVEEICYEEGEMTEMHKYSYDSEGRLVGNVHYKADTQGLSYWPGDMGMRAYGSTYMEYDDEGRIIKKSNSVDPAYGTGGGVTEYRYDKAGNLVEQITKRSGIEEKYEYFYMID